MAAFSKVPRKILGKLLILGATDTQVATSSRGYSATVEHCTNRPISSVQRSNRKLCSSSSNSSSKIRSFPKIFLGTFENAALMCNQFFYVFMFYSPPSKGTHCCDEYVCLSAYLSPTMHISEITRPTIQTSPNFSLHVVSGRGSRHWNTLCTSGFLDYVIFYTMFHTVGYYRCSFTYGLMPCCVVLVASCPGRWFALSQYWLYNLTTACTIVWI